MAAANAILLLVVAGVFFWAASVEGAVIPASKILKAYYGRAYFNNPFRCPIQNNSAVDVTVALKNRIISHNSASSLIFRPRDIAWVAIPPNPLGDNFLTVFYTDDDYADIAGDNENLIISNINGVVRDFQYTCTSSLEWYEAYWGIPFSRAPVGVTPQLIPINGAIYARSYCELSYRVTQQDLARIGVPDPAIGTQKYLLLRWTNCLTYGEGAVVQPIMEGATIIFPPNNCP